MLGLLDKKNQMTLSFERKGDMIYIIGKVTNDIASSQYLIHYHKVDYSPAPYFKLDEEYELHKTILELIDHHLICSAHDVSEGGLFITLLESCIPNQLGFDITTDSEIREDAFLFGEGQGRVVVSVCPSREDEFIDFMMKQKVPFITLGHVTKGELRIDDISYGFIKDYTQFYNKAIEKMLNTKDDN